VEEKIMEKFILKNRWWLISIYTILTWLVIPEILFNFDMLKTGRMVLHIGMIFSITLGILCF